MHADVTALLAVQDDDLSIHELEKGIALLMPRVNAIAAECGRTAAALDQARQLGDAERARRRDVQERIASHRQLQEKHQAILNAITSQREATAAMAQIEQVTRFIADEERELSMIAQRIDEIEKLIEDRDAALRSLEDSRREAEASVADERGKLEVQLTEARARRDGRARDVPRALLSLYDRIRSKRRVHAIYPLRSGSCSHCDTAVPLQRRTELLTTIATDVCQGCGVLVYAIE